MSTILNLVPKKASEQLYSMVRLNKGFFTLLTGGSSYLREESAFYLSKNFLCIGTRDEECPCRSCHKEPEEHPDLLVRVPSSAGNLLVEATNSCVAFLEEHSMVTGKKCVVLHGVDKITPAALGGLLKILEESIPSASIILTAESLAKVAPTLRSRCRTIFVGDNTRKSLFIRLLDNGTNAKTSEELSRIGPMLTEDVSLEKERALVVHKAIPGIVAHIFKGKASDALTKYSEFASKAKAGDLVMLLEMLISTMVDVQKSSFMATSHINMPSRLEWISGLKEGMPEGFLNHAVQAFTKVLECPPHQHRAMIVWAICGLSNEVSNMRLVKE
jgi:hypothetical protein